MDEAIEAVHGSPGPSAADRLAAVLPAGKGDVTALRLVINIGRSELELLRTANEASAELTPLARFTVQPDVNV